MKQGQGNTFGLLLDGAATPCRVAVARRMRERMQGLLAHPPLQQGQGLWIEPCNSVHTCFMRYPIDVVFLDRQGRVVQIDAHVRPWGMRTRWRARAALELVAGYADRLGIAVGARLEMVD